MIRTAGLLTLLLVILMGVGGLIGGKTGVIVAFGIGLALNFFNYWFSSSLVLKAHGAKIVGPGELQWLQDDVREMTERAGMPMPQVAYIAKPGPNAFATGRSPEHAVVAVTQGLLDLCDRREVRAVMAHELGHVRNRDMLTMTLVAGAVSAIAMLAMIARFSAFFGGGGGENRPNPLLLIAVALFAPMIAMFVQMAISRRREYEADAAGAKLSNDPLALASALARLHNGIPHAPPLSETGATAHMMIANPFFGRKLSKMFSTHPDPEERIRRLRAMA